MGDSGIESGRPPARALLTLGICAFSIPALHRVQELNLEEKQWQLDQELRTYMNREGKQDVGRGWYLHKPRDCRYCPATVFQSEYL